MSGASLPPPTWERAPQPDAAYHLDDAVLGQLRATPLDAARPLLVVDVDEVLLEFAGHFARWMQGAGWRLDLTEYRLDGAIRRIKDGLTADRAQTSALIADFFAAEADRQTALPGAAAALGDLAKRAQIVILTNAPLAQREARIGCLRAQGVDFPLVANTGGKGAALRWMWDRTGGPVAIVDDSEAQLASARKWAPGALRLQFLAGETLRRLAGERRSADARAENWREAQEILSEFLEQ